MPASPGLVTVTVTDPNGDPAVCAVWFYDPADPDMTLRDNPDPWTAPSGRVWPARSGALIGDNLLERQVRVVIHDDAGNELREVKIPADGGAVTARTLSRAKPPDGPFVTARDFNGLSFDLS